MLYRCAHCGETVERDSTKQWIKSYCDKTGKNVHLQKVKDAHITNSGFSGSDMQSILAGVKVIQENGKCELYTAGKQPILKECWSGSEMKDLNYFNMKNHIDAEFQDMLDNMNPICEKCGMDAFELRRRFSTSGGCGCDFFKNFVSLVAGDGYIQDVDTRQEYWGNGLNDVN